MTVVTRLWCSLFFVFWLRAVDSRLSIGIRQLFCAFLVISCCIKACYQRAIAFKCKSKIGVKLALNRRSTVRSRVVCWHLVCQECGSIVYYFHMIQCTCVSKCDVCDMYAAVVMFPSPSSLVTRGSVISTPSNNDGVWSRLRAMNMSVSNFMSTTRLLSTKLTVQRHNETDTEDERRQDIIARCASMPDMNQSLAFRWCGSSLPDLSLHT